jgi:hypothetical protein
MMSAHRGAITAAEGRDDPRPYNRRVACPKCGAVLPEAAAECPRCGIIVAKYREREEHVPRAIQDGALGSGSTTKVHRAPGRLLECPFVVNQLGMLRRSGQAP